MAEERWSSKPECGVGIKKMKRLGVDARQGLRVGDRATNKATMCPGISRYVNYVPIPKNEYEHSPLRIGEAERRPAMVGLCNV